MNYKLNHNLGTQDAHECNVKCGSQLELDAAKLAAGETITLNKDAADYLKKKYPALLEEIPSVHGVAKKPGIIAPEKSA